jgi:ATPase subunit of ABC transporter with duplicated ATPase domains
MALSFKSVYFSYPSSLNPVLEDISAEFHPGWTGVTGDNGAGKTTFLMLAAGLLEPRFGKISGGGGVYCSQRTDELPPLWEDLFYAGGGEAGRLMSRLGIEADWPYRWETLSQGERKRLQLGIALWQQPDLLAVDEPTNHLDREARELIAAALESYSGIGLLVSHDRALLDRLCGACLFIRQGKGILRPGGVSRGLTEEDREALEARRLRKRLSDERERLAAEAGTRRREVEGSKNRFSKKRLNPGDNSGRAKINLARLSGKDRTGADLYKLMENRLDRLDERIEKLSTPKQRKEGISLETSPAKMDRLCALPAGSIPLGANRSLSFPELLIRPGERIGLTGPNGAGKSTLIRHILEHIPSPVKVLYIPQELSAREGEAALEELNRESEKNRGEILSRFSRLGSDPRSLIQSRQPSSGETRKLLIARGVFGKPALIVMDEPTNHLDLTSIRLLEETLEQVSCALLLVSHDEAFLSGLTHKEWAIRQTALVILN